MSIPQPIQELFKEVKSVTFLKHAFRVGSYDFIVNREGKVHEKQRTALKYLTDVETEVLVFGGAAGGAKSWTGCAWLLFMCLNYPGTKWFISRNELKKLKKTTLKTWFKVCKAYHAESTNSFNSQDSVIKFKNGSSIDLLDFAPKPSSSFDERFGSLEYTGGWLEEGQEQEDDAFDAISARVGRHMNDFYNIKAKLLITCNPKKNWLYTNYYKPNKEGELDPEHVFLNSLVTDNPFIEKDYIERLKKTKNKSRRQRLLYGNWEYDDDPNSLVEYDTILSLFDKGHFPSLVELINVDKYKKFLTADVARFGSDKAVVFVWADWYVIDLKVFDYSDTVEIQNCINDFRRQYGIFSTKAIADQDGVGGGVVDNCGIEGFVNGGRVKREELGDKTILPNYENLKTQCGYGLARKINQGVVGFVCDLDEEIKEAIIEELEQLKRDRADDDNKKYLKSKTKIKSDIGRSPDFLDALIMRYFFELIDSGGLKST